MSELCACDVWELLVTAELDQLEAELKEPNLTDERREQIVAQLEFRLGEINVAIHTLEAQREAQRQ